MKLLRTLWMLTCFDKTTERLVVKYELHDFDEAHWLHLLGLSDEDILGSYELRSEHIEFIRKYVPAELDMTEYDCFVEFCWEYD